VRVLYMHECTIIHLIAIHLFERRNLCTPLLLVILMLVSINNNMEMVAVTLLRSTWTICEIPFHIYTSYNLSHRFKMQQPCIVLTSVLKHSYTCALRQSVIWIHYRYKGSVPTSLQGYACICLDRNTK